MAAEADDILVQRLLEVINDGERDATYKLALLLAIIEWVTTTSGGQKIPTADLAEIVLAQYFRQVRKFPLDSGRLLALRQGSSPNLRILSAAGELAAAHPTHARVDLIKAADSKSFAKAALEVEKTLVNQPIPRLQTVGKTQIPFLYEWKWKAKQTLGPVKKAGDDYLALVPGVRERLVSLGPLLRPIIEQFWVWDVAKWSKIQTQESRLHSHLFGAKRVVFPKPLVAGLRDFQSGKCFYCSASVAAAAQVDHFIPWSKFPNDAIDNLVLACAKCNGRKRDHLADPTHVGKWLDRPLKGLSEIAAATQWESSPARSRSIAANLYGALGIGSIVWAGGEKFVEMESSHVETIGQLFAPADQSIRVAP